MRSLFGWGLAAMLSVALAACAGTRPPEYDSGLETVVQRTLPMPPPEIAACLARNDNRISYPRGYSPQLTLRTRENGRIILEQWFYVSRNGQWITSFELRPEGAGATEVRVRMPTALTVSWNYARAAQQLVDLCTAAQ
jgi:hypothetical protein